jgi:shikimate dehydrogenase
MSILRAGRQSRPQPNDGRASRAARRPGKGGGAVLRAGVIGWPVGHSLSPALHRHWLDKHRIAGTYEAVAVAPEDLEKFLRSLARSGWRGVNVTIPHKERALACMDSVEPAAERIGAVNTVVVGDKGRLLGSNTDGYGFWQNIIAAAPKFDLAGGVAVILGAGGAARAIAVALIDAGAKEIRVVNRTPARAKLLARSLGRPLRALAWEQRNAALAGAALLVNATSLGMAGQPPLDIDLTALPTAAMVNDIVYKPLETPLLAAAAARGNPVVDGLGMLLHQARPGFRAWFGVDPRVTPDLRRAVLAARAP